jgi:hypothetical protein
LVKLNNGVRDFDILVGADPEFFVAQAGKPVSAHGLIPGDKKKPHKVGFGAVQVDGMALEFNINPAAGVDGFTRNLDAVMTTILNMVPGYEYFDKPVADFGADYIEQQPDVAKMLGCEPDFNAYTMEPNPRPDVKTPFRTASGHIHVGWTADVDPLDPGHFSACARLARRLDFTVGIASLMWDGDARRRQLYGKAGCFRPKPYGMEYRTLSNAWLNPKEKHLRKYVYHQTIKAVKDLFDYPDSDEDKIGGLTAREIIDNNDQKSAIYAAVGGSIVKPKEYRDEKVPF